MHHSRPGHRLWWTSEDRTQREAAQRMCHDCPVEPDCAEWSLHLGRSLGATGVYGGMSGE